MYKLPLKTHRFPSMIPRTTLGGQRGGFQALSQYHRSSAGKVEHGGVAVEVSALTFQDA